MITPSRAPSCSSPPVVQCWPISCEWNTQKCCEIEFPRRHPYRRCRCCGPVWTLSISVACGRSVLLFSTAWPSLFTSLVTDTVTGVTAQSDTVTVTTQRTDPGRSVMALWTQSRTRIIKVRCRASGCHLTRDGHSSITNVLSGHKAQQANASVRAAFVHVVGDLLQSISVLISAVIIFFKVCFTCGRLYRKKKSNMRYYAFFAFCIFSRVLSLFALSARVQDS